MEGVVTSKIIWTLVSQSKVILIQWRSVGSLCQRVASADTRAMAVVTSDTGAGAETNPVSQSPVKRPGHDISWPPDIRHQGPGGQQHCALLEPDGGPRVPREAGAGEQHAGASHCQAGDAVHFTLTIQNSQRIIIYSSITQKLS